MKVKKMFKKVLVWYCESAAMLYGEHPREESPLRDWHKRNQIIIIRLSYNKHRDIEHVWHQSSYFVPFFRE